MPPSQQLQFISLRFVIVTEIYYNVNNLFGREIMEKLNFTKKDTNIIKGIAIIFLMIHHCFRSPKRYIGCEVIFLPLNQDIVTYLASFLKICVPMFVFLTAYGITVSLKNRNNTLNVTGEQMVSYTKHRMFHLYTGWIFVFIFCEIFCMIYSRLPLETYGRNMQGVVYFLIDGLGIANLFGTPTLVGTWWYMSLAVSLVIILPILIKIYSRIGFWYMFLIFSILSRQLGLTISSLAHWTPVVLLGIACADKDWLVKMREIKIIKGSMAANKLLKFIIGIIIIIGLIIFRQSSISSVLFEIKDGVIPFFIIYFLYEFICPVKYLNDVLEFIGKYSMNIFLIHTFIGATYFRKFIYGFKYAPLIVIVLLLISLVIAVLVEYSKKVSGYQKLCNKVNI